MDLDVELLRHVAGDYDAVLGQLCMRCGLVLDEGRGGPRPAACVRQGRGGGFEPGAGVLVSIDGTLRLAEAALSSDRDRSDEADCRSIAEVATANQLCACGHRVDQHAFPDAPGGRGCWCCGCAEYSEGLDG